MNQPVLRHVGGSFAPPLNPEQLEVYKQLANSAPPRQKDAMVQLINMLELFWETPDSKQPGTPHPSGRGVVTPLEQSEIERIWDAVPWSDELDAMGVVFDELQGDVRNAAYHLLWYGRELCLDREPITNDKI